MVARGGETEEMARGVAGVQRPWLAAGRRGARGGGGGGATGRGRSGGERVSEQVRLVPAGEAGEARLGLGQRHHGERYPFALRPGEHATTRQSRNPEINARVHMLAK